MSIESDAASQVVGIYTKGIEIGAQVAIKIGEEVFKLVGEGIQSLIEFIVKCKRQENKVGELKLQNMLRRATEEGKTLTIYESPLTSKEDAEKLSAEFTRYGVPHTIIESENGYEMLVFAEDAPRINRITEKLGFNVVEKGEDISESQKNKVQYETKIPDGVKEYETTDELINNLFDKEKEEAISYDPNIPKEVKEYDSDEELVSGIFGPEKEKLEVKESKSQNKEKVPIKGSDQEKKKKSQSEPISKNAKNSNGKGNRISPTQEMKNIKRERKENPTQVVEKATESGKNLTKKVGAITK